MELQFHPHPAVPHVQWKTPDDGQINCPKHVDLRTRINLEISASIGFIVKKFVTMHGHMNVKNACSVYTYDIIF